MVRLGDLGDARLSGLYGEGLVAGIRTPSLTSGIASARAGARLQSMTRRENRWRMNGAFKAWLSKAP